MEGTRTHGQEGGQVRSAAALATLERLDLILKRRSSGPAITVPSLLVPSIEQASQDDSPLSMVVARGGLHEFLGLDDSPRTGEGQPAAAEGVGVGGTTPARSRGADPHAGRFTDLHDAGAERDRGERGAARARGKGGALWREAWTPPLTMLTWLAGHSLAARSVETNGACGLVVWVGRRVWPSLHALHRCGEGWRLPVAGGGQARRGLLGASLLVDCGVSNREDVPLRVWAAELASRSEACVAVVVDGRGFDRVATQRLQLACEASGCLCVLARSMLERSVLSAAVTRWQVRRAEPSLDAAMKLDDVPEWVWAAGWTARLLRCKGVRPAPDVRDESRAWLLRMVHDGGYNLKFGQQSDDKRQAGGFDLLPILADGPAAAADDGVDHPERAAG